VRAAASGQVAPVRAFVLALAVLLVAPAAAPALTATNEDGDRITVTGERLVLTLGRPARRTPRLLVTCGTVVRPIASRTEVEARLRRGQVLRARVPAAVARRAEYCTWERRRPSHVAGRTVILRRPAAPPPVAEGPAARQGRDARGRFLLQDDRLTLRLERPLARANAILLGCVGAAGQRAGLGLALAGRGRRELTAVLRGGDPGQARACFAEPVNDAGDLASATLSAPAARAAGAAGSPGIAPAAARAAGAAGAAVTATNEDGDRVSLRPRALTLTRARPTAARELRVTCDDVQRARAATTSPRASRAARSCSARGA